MDAPLGAPDTAVRLEPTDAVFLDFDGTLAPLQDDAATVFLPGDVEAVLQRLAARLGAIAIISGRDVRDLARRAPAALWRVGGHGLEVCAPGVAPPTDRDPAPAAIREGVAAVAAAHPGAFVEDKGPIQALHYRQAASAGPEALAALAPLAAEHSDYILQHGKMVIELKPRRAHKGEAVRRLMAAPPFAGRRPIFFGDDATDEDAIAVVQSLGGVGVKVGAGQTAARVRLDAPEDVHAWLRDAAASLTMEARP